MSRSGIFQQPSILVTCNGDDLRKITESFIASCISTVFEEKSMYFSVLNNFKRFNVGILLTIALSQIAPSIPSRFRCFSVVDFSICKWSHKKKCLLF